MLEQLLKKMENHIEKSFEAGIRVGLTLEVSALNGMADKDSDPVKAWAYRNAAREIERCMDSMVAILLDTFKNA